MSRYRFSIVVLALLLAGRPLVAAEFFVSSTGTDRGKGSQESPWSLAKALSHPPAVKPGDTIWLRGGTYTGNFTSHLKGTAKAPIVVRQYPGERATLDGNVNPAVLGTKTPVLAVSNGGYTWFWGLEVTNSNPNRWNPQPGYPSEIRNNGIYMTVPGTKIINCVIHDTAEGIESWQTAVDAELYGNIIYYNGWNAPDRSHGHGIYVNNFTGSSKLIRHNILFDPIGHGCLNIQAYGSKASMFLNSRADGNVWWRGAVLVGGENGFDIGGTAVTGNFSWSAPLNMGYHTAKCRGVAVSGNYLTNVGGGVLSPGRSGCREGETITGNTFVGDLDGFVPGDYPGNTYYSKTSPPASDKVTILPDAYEAGRATVVIYNWSRSETKTVDLAGIVKPGAGYEIRSAQNFFGPPVASGTYTGGSVALPMMGLTPATPVGYAAPPPTGPLFNVFVIIPARTIETPALTGKDANHERR